jgi:hypothetical protein
MNAIELARQAIENLKGKPRYSKSRGPETSAFYFLILI